MEQLDVDTRAVREARRLRVVEMGGHDALPDPVRLGEPPSFSDVPGLNDMFAAYGTGPTTLAVARLVELQHARRGPGLQLEELPHDAISHRPPGRRMFPGSMRDNLATPDARTTHDMDTLGFEEVGHNGGGMGGADVGPLGFAAVETPSKRAAERRAPGPQGGLA